MIANKNQKGFQRNVQGCVEHDLMAQYLFNEASTDKKFIFVATLDCRDAF
jgi:hypothetical protein